MKLFIIFTILLTPLFWVMLLGTEFTFSGIRILDAWLISVVCISLIVIGNAFNNDLHRKDKRPFGQTGPGSDIF